MKRRSSLVLLLALVLILVIATSASASLYAGNSRTTAYGVRADVSTPSSSPYVGSSGEANWVGTPGTSYWVQAGWRYYSGYSYARSYYEYSLPTGYNLSETSNQSWGTTKNYEVSSAGSGYWTVKIAGVTQGSWSYLAAPVTSVLALSESHSSTVVLNTQFNNVSYRGSTTWYSFDQSGWRTDSPYYLSITSLYKFKTLGP